MCLVDGRIRLQPRVPHTAWSPRDFHISACVTAQRQPLRMLSLTTAACPAKGSFFAYGNVSAANHISCREGATSIECAEHRKRWHRTALITMRHSAQRTSTWLEAHHQYPRFVRQTVRGEAGECTVRHVATSRELLTTGACPRGDEAYRIRCTISAHTRYPCVVWRTSSPGRGDALRYTNEHRCTVHPRQGRALTHQTSHRISHRTSSWTLQYEKNARHVTSRSRWPR